MILNWHTTKEDFDLINQIADRAVNTAKSHGISYSKMNALMDIEATHLNGCPLRLQELLTADDANFSHDIFGILRHINRTNGQLEDFFLPRFAA